jgi:hypothetical protein
MTTIFAPMLPPLRRGRGRPKRDDSMALNEMADLLASGAVRSRRAAALRVALARWPHSDLGTQANRLALKYGQFGRHRT